MGSVRPRKILLMGAATVPAAITAFEAVHSSEIFKITDFGLNFRMWAEIEVHFLPLPTHPRLIVGFIGVGNVLLEI